MPYTDRQLQLKAIDYRRKIIKYITGAGAGHTGGSLSCTDILTVLYNRVLNVSPAIFNSPDRDRYIQSKGHSAEALFVVLADRGFYDEKELETLCHYQSHWVGHPTRHVPGVEHNTGGLGHGLSIGVGTAIAGQKDKKDFRVFVLLGDGELAEGSNWEAAMAGAHYKLDNLIAIVDHNTLQISGRTRDVMDNGPLADKFAAFGWDVASIDGHDYGQLTETLGTRRNTGKPLAVIANTVKGRGITFMEDVAKWHHGVPSEKEYAQAMIELDTAFAAMNETEEVGAR